MLRSFVQPEISMTTLAEKNAQSNTHGAAERPRSATATASRLPKQGVTTELLADLVPALPVPRPTRIVVIACGVKVHFPWGRACRAFEGAVREIGTYLDSRQYTVISAAAPLEDPDELIAFLNGQLAQGVDGLVLFHAAYTAGEIGSELGRWLIDHPLPLLSWTVPESLTESGRLESNRLCCQNFLLNMLHRLGVRYAWLNAPPGDEAGITIARFARTVRARARMLHARILHIGGSRVTAFYDGEVDELAVVRRFGLRFDRIDLQAAFDYARKFKDADLQRLRDVIVNSPLCARNDVPDQQIFQTLRIGLAALDMAAQKNYTGCIVKSWPELIDQYGCTTDGSVSMLNDIGLCTAEEGEMIGLLSSLTMQMLSEGEACPTMMDLSQLDVVRNRIGIWHCGASPTRWLKQGTKFEARRHSILENGDPDSAVGLMLEFLLALGPATVLRYQSPDASRAFAFEGELLDTPLTFRGNYCELQPRTPATAGQIMNTILSRGLDHHWSLGFGHWKQDLKMLHHWLGVEDIAVMNEGESCGLSLQ
jgi:L-fucose isomerase-like protein